jgi:hypothetical protein
MKLKQREIAPYRQQQLEHQGNLCALCNEHIDGDAVLDHDHKSGLLRRVLHRGCNALLGKIENSMPMNRISNTRLKNICHNLIEYIEQTHTDIIHPRHKEPKAKTKKR